VDILFKSVAYFKKMKFLKATTSMHILNYHQRTADKGWLLELWRFFVTTWATENGYEIWNMLCLGVPEYYLNNRFTYNSGMSISEV